MAPLAQDDSLRDTSYREAMVEGFSDIVFAITPSGEFIDWNRRFGEVTGYSDEQISSMHPAAFVPQEEEVLVQETIEEVLTSGQAALEGHVLAKDGRQIPYELKGSLISQGDRTVVCVTGCDITAEKQAERALRESERRYRCLFEDAQESIAITTPDGDIVDVNPAACKTSGYSKSQLLKMHVSELYANTKDREFILAALEEHGEVEDAVVDVRRKDGSMITCQISATARRNAHGKIEALQSFIRDVAAEKEAQKALEESEEKFRTLAEKSLIGIALLQHGVYQYVNPAFADLFGYRPGELVGRSPKALFHPADWPWVQTQVRRRMHGKMQEAHYEVRGRTKSGETRILEIAGSRITYQGTAAIIGTVQDITERREMQREVLRIQEEERQRIGQDLHDAVGSSLTGTALVLEALAQKTKEKCPELVDELEQITKMVRESSEDVRRLSRGMSPVHLNKEGLLVGLKQLVKNTGKPEEVTLHIEECDHLLPFPNEAAIHLYWIVQEALTNARKYAGADRIEVRLTCKETTLLLTIDDNGRGFEPAAAQHEGLGMRTMRYRANLLGGSLTVDSEPRQGTSVRCRLPLNDLVQEENASSQR